jgi:hypothetical protein
MHFEERVGLDYIQSKLDTAEKIKQWANALPKTIANPWKTTDPCWNSHCHIQNQQYLCLLLSK